MRKLRGLLPRFYWLRTTGLTGDMTAQTRGWTLVVEWAGLSLELGLLRKESG